MSDQSKDTRIVAMAKAFLNALDPSGNLKIVNAGSTTTAVTSGLRAYPVGTLSPDKLQFADQPVPCSIGVDGLLYGIRNAGGRKQILRIPDGANPVVELGADFSTVEPSKVILTCTRTYAGFVTVLTGGGVGAVYFSPTFTAVGTKVLDTDMSIAKFACLWNHGLPGVNDVHFVGEYSQSIGNAHDGYRTLDGGQTWQLCISTVVVDPAVNSHVHGWAVEPDTGRVWFSNGDGVANRTLQYSDALGAPGTWVKVPDPAHALSTNGWEQPTLMIPGAEGLSLFPDSGLPPMVVQMTRDTAATVVGGAKYDVKHLLTVTDVSATGQWFAMNPHARKDNWAYALYPKNVPGVGQYPDEHIIVASGDAGRSWHAVWGVKLQQHGANVTMREGLVGPDAAGYFYGYLFATNVYLLRFRPLAWVTK